MMIPHPLLGLRDSAEFTYMGDASLMMRPEGMPDVNETEASTTEDVMAAFVEYGYLRDNMAGQHRELWFHEQGDRSWLVVTRDTNTHEILGAELARNVARAKGRSK